ncbi:DUF4270 family protein [Pontibacter sp. G13]|uniref:DUF4270 family protein n=1 Tax=Pontibacter sp. G13 TaxID=3074898 RepID=UPI00288966D1|nr:DUF4270 family protein [Pontibacter sp. G13]WNJ16190.1 DUF4270 family protein [Pontibacter sp. G13]
MSKDTIAFMLKFQADKTLDLFKNSWLSAALAAAAIFYSGCAESIQGLDPDVLPESELIQMVQSDTFSVELETIVVDTTSTYRTVRQNIGNYLDPSFGRISAATYTEFLPREDLSFGSPSDLIFDSLVLNLVVEDAYGRANTPQTLRVYELTERLPDSDAEELPNSTSSFSFDDSRDYGDGFEISLDNDAPGRILRVRLDDELGRRLLFAGDEILSDPDSFVNFFNGLYLGTDPVTYTTREPGAIMLLFLESTSQLELYYRQRDSNNVFFNRVEPFIIISSTPRFTQFTRSEDQGSLFQIESALPQEERTYEFSQGGVLVKNFVKFPTVESLGKVGVSSAQLTLPVDTLLNGSNGRYAPPAQLIAILADDEGVELIENDAFIPIDPIVTGATYDSDEGAYVLDVTDYVQRVTAGQQENNGFFLRPQNAAFFMNRAIMGAVGNPALAPKLTITYSTLPN